MSSTLISRRALTLGMAATPLAVCARAAAAAQTAANPAGLSDSAPAIHQEIVFSAPRRRLYQVLTRTPQFDALTRLSNGQVLLSAPGARPTSISPREGGAFTLFGGYITGRNLQLLPDERLVQAWRAGGWNPGDYSIVRFALEEHGTDTRLVFDHRGFPDGQGAHLASGWYEHYWEPLKQLLALR